MSNLSIKGFHAFCVAQGDTPVNHAHWSTCALGLYLESNGIPVDKCIGNILYCVPEEHRASVKELIVPMGYVGGGYDHEEDSLFEFLNYAITESYGDIIEFIEEGDYL